MPSRRAIPSLEQLLARPALVALSNRFGRDAVVAAGRRAADELRAAFADGRQDIDDLPLDTEQASAWLERRIDADLATRLSASLRPAINATGVIIHTNLGRAPLAEEAMRAMASVATGYSNLEYDLAAGSRGHRHIHAERLLTQLTGAESALVTNNNAAAILLALAALASGREVIVSRGELVEIGGGFRVPDICAQSGAILREVGTTNRTRTADYAAAISEKTALLLRVHPSNFRIEGFTERPPLDELAALARRFSLPLVEDLGSGWLGVVDPAPAALRDEPSVVGSLRAGADLVAFSGDKLLGGPQAGILAGRRELTDRIGRHPLMRAMRADKLCYAALEATLALWARPEGRLTIPVYRMLTSTADEIDRRAQNLAAWLAGVGRLHLRIVDGVSTIGGGSAPGSALPTRLIEIDVEGLSAPALEGRLRAGDPPVLARIVDDRVALDLRTVSVEGEAAITAALTAIAGTHDPSHSS